MAPKSHSSGVGAFVLVALLLLASRVSCDIDSLTCDNYYDDNDGIVPTPGSPTCSSADLHALLQFKASISSDPNHALSAWGASRNCCSWNGITCDGASGRVVRIKLPQQNLKGQLSPALGSLSSLQALILQDNDFHGSIPSSLGNLGKLQRLCISGSASLSGPVPDSFGNLTSLQLLDLSSNSLDGPLPASIGGMSNLMRLILAGNKINGPVPASLGLLSSLYQLYLHNNQLSGDIPQAFTRRLSALMILDLDNNRITGLPADLRNLTQLQSISINKNPLRNSDAVAGIATAPMIAQIELNHCNLTGPFPRWIGHLPHPGFALIDDEITPSIDISNNFLSGEIPASAMASLPNYIQALDFSNNRFSGHIPATIGNLTGLTGLGLDGNQLTGPIPASFAQLQALLSFTVFGNKLSGQIPQVAPFTTFNASTTYQPGNPGLCGTPLPACKH